MALCLERISGSNLGIIYVAEEPSLAICQASTLPLSTVKVRFVLGYISFTFLEGRLSAEVCITGTEKTHDNMENSGNVL